MLFRSSATLVLINSVGLVMGPTAAAILMSKCGNQALFATIGGIEVLLAVFALYRMTARKPVPLEDQGTFVALNPRTSVVAAQAAVQAAIDQEEKEE